ncbi:MAG: serine--tRNA ligase [Bacteroidetes bacterium]|nr:MAG: serine--tRNA ligase [Bacteroidota bacterium]
MLQINLIREQSDEVINKLKIKNFNATEIVSKLLAVDTERRSIQKKLDDTLADSNSIAREIGHLFKSGKQTEANALREKTSELKQQVKELQGQLNKLEDDQSNLLVLLPNVPHESVPAGQSSEENEIINQEGIIGELPDNALPHWELAGKYDIIGFELGTKITGAGFPVYKGKGAKLQRALISFFLDEAIKAGYTEYQPPLLVNEASAFATGQLPDKDGQMYHVPIDNLFLIPTSEVPVTNFYRDMILQEDELPIKNTAYSVCFRREAGSYGKDVRGLNRLHQFDKVEIVQVTHPEKSYDTLEEMLTYVSGLLKKLELPFRVARLCGGDLSFASAMTYDMEVYSSAQKRWLEVSSISNFETFQSNRMKLRFKNKEGKISLAHTLNGSALALPRILAALLENNQTSEGIRVPKVLIPYTGFEMIS